MTYAKNKGMEHYRINSSKTGHVIKGIYHIQNVNGYHARLSHWIDRFKSVSTKYLDNYLAWFQFLEMTGFDATTSNIPEVFVSTAIRTPFNKPTNSPIKVNNLKYLNKPY